MNKFCFFLFSGILLLFPFVTPAALQHRGVGELVPQNINTFEIQNSIFNKKLSYDEQGSELVSAQDETFSVSDWSLKYARGFLPELEVSFLVNYRSVKLSSSTTNAISSGLESLNFEGKYQIFADSKSKHLVGLHFKKAMFTNTQYDLANPPPTDKVALGDDGIGLGADYLITYFDKYFKYDFKLGYNKPASNLSSEIVYNAEIIKTFSKLFFFSGFGGIYSLKNDPYSNAPATKPSINSGNSRYFNSINRDEKYWYAGSQLALGSFIIGVKASTIVTGKSIDSGSTILLSLHYEKNESFENSELITKPELEDYFAEGFVEEVSKGGNIVKINLGSENHVEKDSHIDIFNIDDYSRGRPIIATGIVVEVGPRWSFAKIVKRFSQSPIHISYIAKAY